jgi:signal transduction histidine kinase
MAFLDGGGEMGARMRAFAWRGTPLGPPAGWPQSLKTIVRMMLDSRFAMWMAWGPEHTFFCNDAYLPTLGNKRDWALGARADVVWAEVWHAAGPRIEHVKRTGQATWDEGLELFLRRSGYEEETFHTFSYSPVHDDDNRVAGMLCVVVETTESVIGERRLALLRDLAAQSPVEAESMEDAGRRMLTLLATRSRDVPYAALYLLSADGQRLQLVGSTRAPVTGPLPPVLAAEDPGSRWQAGAALRDGQPHHLQDLPRQLAEIPGPWGQPVQQALVMPLAGAGGVQRLGVLVLGVSTRRRLDEPYRSFMALVASQVASRLAEAQALVQARERVQALAELDRAKNDFFSNVSHEFRTPLTLMLGPVEDLIDAGGLTPEQAQALMLVRRNGQRLRKLVNALLDFSRIEAGRMEADREPTDLAALTADLASTFRAAVEQAGLLLDVDCPPLPAPVWVDRDMWEKVVLNLLSNALKFTFTGRIGVQLVDEGSQVRLEVCDTGVGIPSDALPRLFDRFQRVSGTRSRTQEGTGIGLALVRELVRLHGGTVAARSTVGEGSCFSVSLPRGEQPPHVDGGSHSVTPGDRVSYVDEALRADSPAESTDLPSQEVPRTAGQRVLVVDDNADMRAYIERLLQPHWRVETARDGLEALQRIAHDPPDLLLTDLMMPRLDGRGLLRAVRQPNPRAPKPALPVIVLSAQAGEDARLAMLAEGADDYLVKPFSARELLARVELQLARAQIGRVQQAADRAKDEFIAMLGHELRNPLAPMLTALKLIQMQWPEIAQRERGILERQVRHMVRLVDDLLDVARVTRGRIILRKESLQLSTAVDAACEIAGPLIEQRQHRLTVDVPGEGLLLLADPVRLAQVVSNLLTNAARFTEPGGDIHVAARNTGDGHVELSVSDTGAGMSQTELSSVFELFVQGRQALHRPHGGLGLGLPIARSLVALHGGTLCAESAGIGHGSRFVLRLPQSGGDADPVVSPASA